ARPLDSQDMAIAIWDLEAFDFGTQLGAVGPGAADP
ncbi:MAG: hypothetical protein ACI8XO_002247, partial [Verrucomicrobiales bacterium]